MCVGWRDWKHLITFFILRFLNIFCEEVDLTSMCDSTVDKLSSST